MSKVTESFLSHYGKKGMKWGVRKSQDHPGPHKQGKTPQDAANVVIKSRTSKTGRLTRPATDVTVKQKPGKFVRTSGGKRQTASNDAVRIAAARQFAKKSTTDSLSTKQLQDAVNRMELEIKYAKAVKQMDRRNRGRKMVDKILGRAKNKESKDFAIKTAKTIKTAVKTAGAAAV